MTTILSQVQKYTARGRFETVVFNVRWQFGTNTFDFSGLAMIVCIMRSQFEAPRHLSQATAGPSCYRGLTELAI